MTAGGYHYLYGTAKVNKPYHFGKSVYVARVPVGKLLTSSAWRYWNGRSWSTQQSSAKAIVNSSPAGWSTSFSVHRTPSGRYQMVTKENDVLGSDVVTGVAASPVGPFTRKKIATYTSFSPKAKTQVTYNPMAHVDLKVRGGVLGHISRNDTNMATALKNPVLYKPQFFTVPTL